MFNDIFSHVETSCTRADNGSKGRGERGREIHVQRHAVKTFFSIPDTFEPIHSIDLMSNTKISASLSL